MNLVFSILITTPVLLQFSGVLVSIPSRLSINSHHSLDLGTVECGSWHGEPDPWAFQQHSLCTADIPGTRGSSYSSSLLPRLVPCLLSSPFFFHEHTRWREQVVRDVLLVLPAILSTNIPSFVLSLSSFPQTSSNSPFFLPPFSVVGVQSDSNRARTCSTASRHDLVSSRQPDRGSRFWMAYATLSPSVCPAPELARPKRWYDSDSTASALYFNYITKGQRIDALRLSKKSSLWLLTVGWYLEKQLLPTLSRCDRLPAGHPGVSICD